MRITCPSLSRPNIFYLVDGLSSWQRGHDRRTSAIEWCRWYDTMGDGTTQHSPDEPIANADLADCCVSLATHLIAHPEDTEALSKCYHFSRAYRPEIDFYASVRYQENKPQYFNRTERTLSRSANKRHDKRWTAVLPWMNGTITAIWGLHNDGATHDTLTNVITLDDICIMRGDYYNIEEFFNLPANTKVAIDALHYLMLARCHQSWAMQALENYTNRQQQTAA